MKAKYCIKCGTFLNGENVCPVCGYEATEFEMPETSREPKYKNNFETVTINDIWKNAERHNSVRRKVRWCPNCYARIPDGANRCPNCGCIINDESE